jgi:hypothetical protein
MAGLVPAIHFPEAEENWVFRRRISDFAATLQISSVFAAASASCQTWV